MLCIKPSPPLEREQLQVVHLHLAALTEPPDLHRKRKRLRAIGNPLNQRSLRPLPEHRITPLATCLGER